jgi:hypothetical protein
MLNAYAEAVNDEECDLNGEVRALCIGRWSIHCVGAAEHKSCRSGAVP